MPRLELYHCAYSVCSQKVRLCLAEKGVQWISREVDLANGEQTRTEFLAINPNGTVPAVLWDGWPVIESSVICEFIDEVFEHPQLVPADPVDRARMRAWLRLVDEIATPAIRVPSLSGKILQRMRGLSDKAYEASLAAKPIRQFTFRKLGRDGFSAEERRASDDQIKLVIRRMELALREGDWLNGGAYTLADTCMTPVIQRLSDLGLENYWASAPGVTDWFERVRARSSFITAFYPGSFFTDRVHPDWPCLPSASGSAR
jgi:glutathione S-transferase